MFLVSAIQRSLGLKVSVTLALPMLALTALAAGVITWRQQKLMEEMTLEKGRLAAEVGAREFGDMLDEAIDNGVITVNDAFDTNYVEIKGFDWGQKPKYHTRYDFVTDRAAVVFQDRFLEDADFVYAVGVDKNGYLPTHNTIYQNPVTGDPAKDGPGNRTKRMFNNQVELAAARNLEPGFTQIYPRDTGVIMWDVSAPIFVKGKHWGGFRVGVSMKRIAEKQAALLLSLLVIFGLFAVVSTFTIWLMLQRAMRPVVRLTHAAEEISLGEGLDTPIRATSSDEIGQLTSAVERLRASMKAAMSRLGE